MTRRTAGSQRKGGAGGPRSGLTFIVIFAKVETNKSNGETSSESNNPKGISIGSMDYDSPKVYGDTSIFDILSLIIVISSKVETNKNANLQDRTEDPELVKPGLH